MRSLRSQTGKGYVAVAERELQLDYALGCAANLDHLLLARSALAAGIEKAKCERDRRTFNRAKALFKKLARIESAWSKGCLDRSVAAIIIDPRLLPKRPRRKPTLHGSRR